MMRRTKEFAGSLQRQDVMHSQLTQNDFGAAIIVDARQVLNSGEQLSSLRQQINAIADSSVVWVLLDMSGITSLRNIEAGALVRESLEILRAGAEVKLTNVGRQLRNFLETCGIDTLFEIYPDQATAVRSFESACVSRPVASPTRSEIYWG
jgi:anti-anti-sigma regulatory factor